MARRKVVISTGAGELRTTGGERSSKRRKPTMVPVVTAQGKREQRPTGARAPLPVLPDTAHTRQREQKRLLAEFAAKYPRKSRAEQRREGVLDFLKGATKAGLKADLDYVIKPTLETGKEGSKNIWLLASDPAEYWRKSQREESAAAARGVPTLGIVPVGPFGRAGAPKGKVSPETLGRRAEQQVDELLAVQRKGVPRLGGKKEPLGPPVPKTPEQQVREALGPARKAALEKRKGIAAEKGQRSLAAEQARQAAGGGLAGIRAEYGALKGEYAASKVKFEKLREGNLSQEEVEGLLQDITDHPELTMWQKRNARRALADAFEEGKPLRPFEIKQLQTVFGEEAIPEIQRFAAGRKLGNIAMETLNIPRALMATLDVSAPFRQGLVSLGADPKIFAKNFPGMFRQFASAKKHHATLEEIRSRPTYPLMERANLQLTELGELAGREEAFMSNYAETLTGGKVSPVRASGRAYVGFLDRQRADLFDKYLKEDIERGVNVESQKYLRDLGRYVNAATGRGGLGKLEGAAVPLNSLLFSPRLISSRLAFMNPKWYASLHPAVRRHAGIAAGRTAAGGAAVLSGGAALGAQVTADPRSSDFAKLRVGNTRVDILGGFQQYPRVASQVLSGQRVSPTSGKVEQLGSGPGQTSPWEVAARFGRGKLAPVPSFAYDVRAGEDYAGQPFNLKTATKERLTPLGVQDTVDLYKESGNPALAAGGFGLAALGFGVQSYHDRTPDKIKARHADYGQKILEGAIKTGLLPKGSENTPQIKRALKLRTDRYINREKEGADDTRSRFVADVKYLLKIHAVSNQSGRPVTKAQADRAIAWAKGEDRDYLVERELRHLSDWYFDDLYGDALADARQKLRERGYDLPRLR